jgi:hypothetical protein
MAMTFRALLFGSALAWSVACTGTVDDDNTQSQASYCDRGFCDVHNEIGPDAGVDAGSDAGSADAGPDGGIDAGSGSGSGSGSACDGH